jgi:hypothetical protein
LYVDDVVGGVRQGMDRRFSKSIYQEAFEWDGSLRDLYALSTSVNDWHDFLRFVKSARYPFSFHIDSAPAPLPEDAAAALAIGSHAKALLQIDLGGVMLNCHFFHAADIELDIDPREVVDDAKAEAELSFMTELGNASKKEVRLTPENSPESIIFRFDPVAGRMHYLPAPDRT